MEIIFARKEMTKAQPRLISDRKKNLERNQRRPHFRINSIFSYFSFSFASVGLRVAFFFFHIVAVAVIVAVVVVTEISTTALNNPNNKMTLLSVKEKLSTRVWTDGR